MAVTIASSFIAMPASATPNATEAQSQYDELKKKVDEIQEKIEDLNLIIEPIAIKVENNKKQMSEINKQIETTRKDIEATKVEISEKEEVLGDRLREVYKSGGQTSYISLLFSAESFSDLISKLDITNRLVKTDKKMVNELSEKQDKLNEKVNTLQKKSEEIKKINEETEKQLKELDVKVAEQNQLIAEAKSKAAVFEKEVLAVEERQIVKGLVAVCYNTNASVSELKNARSQLKAMVQSQIKGPTVISEVNAAIKNADKLIEQKEAEESAPNRGDGGVVSGDVQAVINEAYKHLGKPYVWGATGPNSFDCSGFTSYVYKKATGIYIGRNTGAQIGAGRSVSRAELRPGDLVFTHPGHVGIYVGNGNMIHAPQTGDVVKVSSVYKFYAARRIIQ